MTANSTNPRFLVNGTDLGLVAVGFSGGQVGYTRPVQPDTHLTRALSQCKPGVDAAPMALIESGLIDQLRDELALTVHHDGKVHSYTELLPAEDQDYRNMKKPRGVSAVTQKIAEQVYEHAVKGRFVLTLGGDHSIAIGTIGGTAKAVRERLGREIAVIWVDAHADINTPETSESGNIHGMPVAFLTGLAKEEKPEIFGWLKDENRISPHKLVYIGLRDIDRGEKVILREHGIKAFSMHDVDRYVRRSYIYGVWLILTFADMASARSWTWLWVGSAAIPPSTYPLMLTLWIQCGPLARVRQSAVDSLCVRETSSLSACTRLASSSRWILSRSTLVWRLLAPARPSGRVVRWSVAVLVIPSCELACDFVSQTSIFSRSVRAG